MEGAINLDLPGADVRLYRDWLPEAEADALFHTLRAEISWHVHRIRLFGREVDSPRLSGWIGDPEAVYTYSGTRFEPMPWPPALQPVREQLTRTLAHPFNSMLANLYRDGRDAMGWHSDAEPELGPRPVIASLSLGAVRRFALKQRRDPAVKRVIELPHGSLLVMAGQTQRNYRHALPRTARPIGERINLTFRQILG